jgi:ParB family chromosome partitioning protein
MAPAMIQHFPLDKFRVDQRVRERLNPELVDKIANSFKAVGQLQPVRARLVDDLLWMIEGHHRLAAAQQAAMKTLACIIEEKPLDDGEVIQQQLVMNCLRESPTGLEEARGLRQLMEANGWNASQAAAATGFSNATVTRRLAMLSLPPYILEQVEAGKISPSSAYELSTVTDLAKQAELATQLAEGRMTRDGITGARKTAKRPAKRGEGQPSRVTAILGQSRSITVSSAGLTLERFIDQIEELLTKARKVRSQGVELGTFIKMLRDQARAS